MPNDVRLTHFRGLALAVAIFATASALQAAPNPFEEIIRKTEPLTPEQEAKTFHLPPGFEIQLVAADPDIDKPINLAFDAKGRLWVSQSRDYPFPAAPGTQGHDKIMVLSDFAPDGRAQKITAFAENLSIPIGLYPYKNGVIAHTIPNVYFFQDTTGAGRADKQEKILGRFGFEKDTHGMTSNFRRGYDGWLYADHGFNNDSVVTASDGSSITMNSGNVYRFRIDGSHVEQFTWGLVNPFGLMFDPMGDLFASDCETRPDYLLYRGAYYPSFGKPHDGLGFAPEVMHYMHGSTAMAGMIFYDATNFPADFRNNTLVGNVLTSRINRDSFIELGSTRAAHEQPDFLATDDPWFRPVNLALGPDGAIYVADFYNRIIGHYEVSLSHPGRDRTRGRIWRIFYRPGGAPKPFDCSKSDIEELWSLLDDGNISVRMLATDEITDRIGAAAIEPLRAKLAGASSNRQRTHGLWALHRLGGLTEELLQKMAKDESRRVRTHSMKVLADKQEWTEADQKLALAGLEDENPWVKRSAADALGRHPKFEQIHPLIAARLAAPLEDAALVHVIRMALRDHLISDASFKRVGELNLKRKEARVVADVCPGVHSGESAAFLLSFMDTAPMDKAEMLQNAKYAARYLPAERMDELAAFSRKHFADDTDFQLTLLQSVLEGNAQRGGSLTPELSQWGRELTSKLLAESVAEIPEWWNRLLDDAAKPRNPWHTQPRISADGDTAGMFVSSLPGGEQLTGVLRSANFKIPERLTFFMAGHNGYPNKNDAPKNFVRLRLADGTLVKEEVPPRHDTARKYNWDLASHAGQDGYIEIVDGDTATAYAWIAVGRWEPAVIKVPAVAPARQAERVMKAAELAVTLGLNAAAPDLAKLLAKPTTDTEARLAIIKALGRLDPVGSAPALKELLESPSEPSLARAEAASALADQNTPETRATLLGALATAPQRLQAKIALALASGKTGAEGLLDAVEAGKASPRLLREKAILERLRVTKPEGGEARIATLTSKLPAATEERQKLIEARLARFDRSKADTGLGAKVFEKNCMICHQLDSKGASIGPQLDGVGGRGTERIMEDVLDPSRNVDRAFRYSTVTLKNDEVISGLQRREEGELVVFADSTGKEISVPKKDIKERVESQYSLMPDNFGEALPIEDFDNLIAFLLTKNPRK